MSLLLDFRTLPPHTRQDALTLLQQPDAVVRWGRDEYGVLGPTTGNRRVRVWLDADGLWRCNADHEYSPNQDRPCIHMVVAFARLGHIEFPTAGEVHRKGRDRSAERRAWRRMTARFPEVLEQLLRAGVPAIAAAPGAKPADDAAGGHPRRKLEAVVYQAVYRVWHRMGMEASQGIPNPWGACCASTLLRFHADPDMVRVLKLLLALSLWPVRDLERTIYPDGTGLSPQHFRAYYDEKYRHKKPKKRKRSLLDAPENAVLSARDVRLRAKQLEQEAKRIESAKQKPRTHTWAYAEFLWAYESTMIAALHFQATPFGEAPKFLPLLEQARFMLNVREVGGDKAYDANYIFQYATAHDIEAHIRIRDTGIPTRSTSKKKYRKAAMLAAMMDPEGHDAKAGRRNLAESGNAAFKRRLGDEVFCRGRGEGKQRDTTSLEVEVHCMALAWNITRLVIAEERHGAKPGKEAVVKLDFAGGAERIKTQPWRDLPELERELRKLYPPTGTEVREQWKP